jgi:tRNA pseudouridine38-40 synthase
VSRNLKITLAYDGSEFHGWQVQPGLRTVQGTLADCLKRLTGEDVLPQGSGRTDAGVHALAQVASVQLESPIPERNLVTALNDVLPPSVRVTLVEAAPDDFHARHSAKAKTYRYRIYRGDICTPFLARYVYHDPYPMNEEAAMRASEYIVGTHDFTSFAASQHSRSRERDRRGTGGLGQSRKRAYHSLVAVGTNERRVDLHCAWKWIPAPHGAKPGGDVSARGQRFAEDRGRACHPRSP